MTTSGRSGCWKLRLVSALTIGRAIAATSSCDRAFAQSSNIVPDGTLGAESSRVVPLDSSGFPIDVIEHGAERGQNLFHSFREFNVSEGRGAYFVISHSNNWGLLRMA
jgi:large exoprotein involved in heme utilization and adhesion